MPCFRAHRERPCEPRATVVVADTQKRAGWFYSFFSKSFGESSHSLTNSDSATRHPCQRQRQRRTLTAAQQKKWELDDEQLASIAGSQQLMDMLMLSPSASTDDGGNSPQHRLRRLLRQLMTADDDAESESENQQNGNNSDQGRRRDALYDCWMRDDPLFRQFVDAVMAAAWGPSDGIR